LSGGGNSDPGFSYKVDKVLDAGSLMCPGPILLLSSSISSMPRGSVVMVIARDPAFEEDLKSWSAYTGNEILDIRSEGGEIIAVIRKNR